MTKEGGGVGGGLNLLTTENKTKYLVNCIVEEMVFAELFNWINLLFNC